MVVDAHFHLWDPRSQPHTWLSALPSLNHRFGLEDYEAVAIPADVTSGILVQALASASETDDLLAIADSHKLVAGVVGWLDLERNDVPAQIERLRSLPGESVS